MMNGQFEKLVFKKIDEPLVSIILACYNNWDHTYDCLKSICINTTDVDFEMIIADDGSTDETIHIHHYVENAMVVRDGVNRGYIHNVNHSTPLAKGKYLLFLNNDTQVCKGWLRPLVDLLEENEKIGMVGPKLIYPDGRLQEAGGIIWSDASGINYGRGDDPDKPEYNYVKEVDYVTGACYLIRSCLRSKIGGLDERYAPCYYDDTDLAFQVRSLGYKVMYQPMSVVIHMEGLTHGTDTNKGVKSYQVKNKEKFFGKWAEVLKESHHPRGQDLFWARDRSNSRKTILVIDHYVPHYDCDAGGRCTYHYLKLFAKMGLKVIFIGNDFIKHEPYTSDLQQLGIEVLYGKWHEENIISWIRKNGKYFDYVYLNRPKIANKYIQMIREYTKAKILYFGHDLHYIRVFRNYKMDRNPTKLEASNRWKKLEFDLMKQADAVHVVSTHEKMLIKREFPQLNVRNIPLYICDYMKPCLEEQTFEQRSGLLFVGGFNHHPNQDGITWFANHVFPDLITQIPTIKLYIVGSNPPENIKNLQSDLIEVTGYVKDDELASYYNKCKVVIVPLRYGAGCKGKVVEALHYRVPIVATSIGAEGIKRIKSVISIANQSTSFSSEIIRLYQNRDDWNLMQEKLKQFMECSFTMEKAMRIIRKDILG